MMKSLQQGMSAEIREGGVFDLAHAHAGPAAEHLTTYWDQNSAMYVLSPIATTLERVVEGWLQSLFCLSETTVAGFVSATSAANLCGLAAARYRLLQNLGWDVSRDGLFGAPRIRVVAGEQAHSTVMKAIALLGFGQGGIEWVEVDDQGRITPERLRETSRTPTTGMPLEKTERPARSVYRTTASPSAPASARAAFTASRTRATCAPERWCRLC